MPDPKPTTNTTEGIEMTWTALEVGTPVVATLEDGTLFYGHVEDVIDASPYFAQRPDNVHYTVASMYPPHRTVFVPDPDVETRPPSARPRLRGRAQRRIT